jgi:hypothetical protein
MTTDRRDEEAKEKIKEGMAEAGKGTAGKPGGTGGPQESGRTDEVAEGMAEAGRRPTEPAEEDPQRQPS